jgi:hypothetical protein
VFLLSSSRTRRGRSRFRGIQWRVRYSPVSRRFHPSDLRVSALLRPPRSGVSRLAFGRRQIPSHRSAAHTHRIWTAKGESPHGQRISHPQRISTTQRLADYWHAGTRAETGTNVKGTTRMPADQIIPQGTGIAPAKMTSAVRTAFRNQVYGIAGRARTRPHNCPRCVTCSARPAFPPARPRRHFSPVIRTDACSDDTARLPTRGFCRRWRRIPRAAPPAREPYGSSGAVDACWAHPAQSNRGAMGQVS